MAVVKFLLPIMLQDSYYQLHRDEYLYIAEGKHLDWGYLEVPPLLPLFAWVSNHLGGSFFWVKFWPNLFGVFTLLLTGRIILLLGGKQFALLLGCLPFLIGGYLRLFYLLHPNFLDVFFWTLMAYSLMKFIKTARHGWLYVFGVAIGLGMMSKYSSAFYAIALLIGLAISIHRKVFANRHLYLAGLLALLIMAPNIYWQYAHHFPLVNHMQELQESQLQYIKPANFLIDQVMMNLAFLFIWVAGLYFLIISPNGKPFRLFGWAYAAVIIFLMVFHGKNYYALGAYPVLFALGGFYLEQVTANRFSWVRYAMVMVPAVICITVMPLVLPIDKPGPLAAYYKKIGLEKIGDFQWEDQQYHPLPQDFADMIGWREMTAKAAKLYHALPPDEQKQTLVYARGYFTAGALNYYGPLYKMPEVYSDNASFLFWMPVRYRVRNLLFLGRNMPGKDDPVFQQFEKVTVLDSVNMPLFRENGMKFILYENANNALNSMIEKEVKKLKAKYER